MESGKEQNYWPAFVDALSNVVLTLVFVLVIFVFALVMGTQQAAKKMDEAIRQKSEEAATASLGVSPEEIERLKRELKEKEQEIELLRKMKGISPLPRKDGPRAEEPEAVRIEDVEMESDKEIKKEFSVSAVREIKDKSAIRIDYKEQTVELDAKTSSALELSFADAKKLAGKNYIVLIKSYLGGEAYSVARRLAYYRAINVRNRLISQLHESPGNIKTNIVQPAKRETGRVEITFQKK